MEIVEFEKRHKHVKWCTFDTEKIRIEEMEAKKRPKDFFKKNLVVEEATPEELEEFLKESEVSPECMACGYPDVSMKDYFARVVSPVFDIRLFIPSISPWTQEEFDHLKNYMKERFGVESFWETGGFHKTEEEYCYILLSLTCANCGSNNVDVA